MTQEKNIQELMHEEYMKAHRTQHKRRQENIRKHEEAKASGNQYAMVASSRKKDLKEMYDENGAFIYNHLEGSKVSNKGINYRKPVGESETRRRLEANLSPSTIKPIPQDQRKIKVTNPNNVHYKGGEWMGNEEKFQGQVNPQYDDITIHDYKVKDAIVFYDIDKLAKPGNPHPKTKPQGKINVTYKELENHPYKNTKDIPTVDKIKYTLDHYNEMEEYTINHWVVANDQGYHPYDDSIRLRIPFRANKLGSAVIVTKKEDNKIVDKQRRLVGEPTRITDEEAKYGSQHINTQAAKKATGTDMTGWHDPRTTNTKTTRSFRNHLLGVTTTIIPLETPGDDTHYTLQGRIGLDGIKPVEVHAPNKQRTCPNCKKARVAVKDHKRFDTVCPICGYVHNRVNTYQLGQNDYNSWNNIVTEEEINTQNEKSMGNENPNLEE